MELKLNSGRIIKFKCFLGARVPLLQGDIYTMKMNIAFICANSLCSTRNIFRDLTFALNTGRAVEMEITVVDENDKFSTYVEYHKTVLAAKSRAKKLNKIWKLHC